MMQEEQRKEMTHLSEKLAEVFIREANPDNWPGGTAELPAEINPAERTARDWAKKNAAATLAIVARIESLLCATERREAAKPMHTGAMDEEIAKEVTKEITRAEKAAIKILREASAKNGVKH